MNSTSSQLRITKYVRKVTWIGLIVNLALSGIKLIAGIIGESQAVVADSIHSLSDALTDIAIILGSHFWAKPPDEGHPYGHRRVETFVTIFIGVMLCIAGIGIGWDAIISLRHKGLNRQTPGFVALLATLLSMVTKEILYRWTIKIGEKIKSTSLKANAWHHRSDALSSFPAFIAVGVAIIYPKFNFIDSIGAIIVSVFIIQAAFKIIMPNINELADVGAPFEATKEIEKLCYEVDNVKEVHDIRTRYISGRIHVDMHLVVDGSMSVEKGHDISHKVEDLILKKGPDVIDVTVHIEPDKFMRFNNKPN